MADVNNFVRALSPKVDDQMKNGGVPIYVIRHGQTDMNQDDATSVDRIRGWANVPLNDKGRQDAVKTGQQLKSAGIRSIITSDLGRAAETADIIGKILGVAPQLSHKLRPWNLGDLTGSDTKDAIPVIAQHVQNPEVPVPDGESFQVFHNRAFQGIDEAVQNNPAPVAIVTHHRNERLLKAWEKTGQNN